MQATAILLHTTDGIQAVPWSCVAGKSSDVQIFWVIPNLKFSPISSWGQRDPQGQKNIVRYEPETYFGRWANHTYFPSPSDRVFSVVFRGELSRNRCRCSGSFLNH